jgi:DinB superfamily
MAIRSLQLKEDRMSTKLAQEFRRELAALQAELLGLNPRLADSPWRVGGWTRKQIVGHLLDSATNNRQRFVRAAADGHYVGPRYAQDAWVAAHGYAEQDWETLLRWWQTEHEILAAVVDRIPEERLDTECAVGDDAPVTLKFLIEDYLTHQRWHFAQMTSSAVSE